MKRQTKAQLEWRLLEAIAAQAHVPMHAQQGVEKLSQKHLMASGVVLRMSFIGGKECFPLILIRDGLSDETIACLKKDFARSFELATMYKPKPE